MSSLKKLLSITLCAVAGITLCAPEPVQAQEAWPARPIQMIVPSSAGSGTDALARAMAQHGYHLQYLLYAVAVHRLLQQRLPDYDYERHFGGVMYLFVRGVRPGWSGAGVHADRPPRETIERLSALLDGARKDAL